MNQEAPVRNAPRGVLLGIDHGSHVIGVALCDASWLVARPLALLARRTRAEDFAKIQALLTAHNAVAMVLGVPEASLPGANDQGAHSQADTVRRWATRLAAAIPLPIYLWDEGYSTSEAELMTMETEGPFPDRLDDRAAAVMLQSFIDAHPVGQTLPEPIRRRSINNPPPPELG
jgi:putative holliday junction resolvase